MRQGTNAEIYSYAGPKMQIFSKQKPLIFAATLSLLSMTVLVCLTKTVFAELKQPTGDVILVVTGKIGESNGDGEARFDRDMLESLGMETLKTATPFEEGIQTFEGPLLSMLLRHVDATGDLLLATALDGYTVEIPVTDAIDYPVILAMAWNGVKMGVRNKGPVWIIYPIDQHPELVQERFSARSVWQLNRIEIR